MGKNIDAIITPSHLNSFEISQTDTNVAHTSTSYIDFMAAQYSNEDLVKRTLLKNTAPKQRLSLSEVKSEPGIPEDFVLHPTRLAAVGAIGIAGVILLERYQENAWWRVPRTQFRFVNDGNFVGNFDKLGHTFGSYVQSSAVQTAMEWSGYEPQTAGYIGFVTALAQQTYIEVNDGITQIWGFSPGDMFSNIIGSIYPLAQTTFPELRHFTPKVSYMPSNQYKSGMWKNNVDDYEGMTFWMSVDIHHYLPLSLKRYWPKILNLAIGTGVRNFQPDVNVQHTLYIALDINAKEIPGDAWFLNGLKNVLNYIHLPMPALLLSPKIAGFAFYF
ncbi:MAG: YfiM family protein [Bacteroidetes bacterium]|nr:YfiM family protein [Bacteroidota bacterium]MCL5738887.1 YfiM family protein [Bacteroidota bacterium]